MPCRFPPHRRAVRGTTLLELMLGMTIAVTLLTAVAFALVAMGKGIGANDAYIRSQQAGQVAIEYLTSSVRRARDIDVGPLAPTSGLEVRANQLTIVDTADDYGRATAWRTFIWDSASQSLSVSITDAPATRILSNVSNLTFRGRPEPLASDPTQFRFRYVTIEMTVSTLDQGKVVTSGSFAGTVHARSIALQ